MTAQVTEGAALARRPRPARRVRLVPVARRDAAQRLSLALTLLARAIDEPRASVPPSKAEERSA